MTQDALRTRDQARAWLESHGVSQADFCRYHKLQRMVLTDLLRGHARAKRGESHRAAVLLGIKPAPHGQPPLPEPLAKPAKPARAGHSKTAEKGARA